MDTDLFEPFLIFSENMVGIDFVAFKTESALAELARLSQELIFDSLEFNTHNSEWGFDHMQFRKGEW